MLVDAFCKRVRRCLAGVMALACVLSAQAEDLSIQITGVNPVLGENVRNHIRKNWSLATHLESERRRREYLNRARFQSAVALRPWGYYAPNIIARLEPGQHEAGWTLLLEIDPGPAVRIGQARVELLGPGAANQALAQWRSQWPLQAGDQLDQAVWEAQKQLALDTARSNGFLQARFSVHRIALDLDRTLADLELTLETGPQAVMGAIDYQQDIVRPHVLAPLSRFEPGDPYDTDQVEELRLDLWKTGFFSDIEVLEQRDLERDPPVVDFIVRMQQRNHDTHQGTLGFGTDTRFRAQYSWTRHLLSDRGDSLGFAAGWRQRDSELLASAEYRLPRRTQAQQYWLINAVLKRESQDFILQDDDGRELLQVASGQVVDAQLKMGRLRLLRNGWSRRQIAETLFVDLLHETDSFRQNIVNQAGYPYEQQFSETFRQSIQTLSLGMEWDWPVIRGSGFDTTGHHERAWWFTANEAWGSDKSFSQVYLSARWNHLLSDRWKVLLKAEAGYTDAELEAYEIQADGVPTTLFITELPFRYRFKTGGSHSVRGYGFNHLSNNGIGSNHVLVGSAELEYRLQEHWSLAGFYDVGNAFNHWGERSLKHGWGLGVRWYSIIGVVRADIGRAEDIEGKPWEIYITIGTPLL